MTSQRGQRLPADSVLMMLAVFLAGYFLKPLLKLVDTAGLLLIQKHDFPHLADAFSYVGLRV